MCIRDRYDIHLEGECYSVVQARYIHQEDPADILLFALFNVVEELVREEPCCVAFQDAGNITTLIFCGESPCLLYTSRCV